MTPWVGPELLRADHVLEDFVAAITGVRVLLVHARDDDAARFYRRFGFESSPVDRLTLLLLMKDIRADDGGAPTD